MTNWLDPEHVASELSKVTVAARTWGLAPETAPRTVGIFVLEAIASLPEPEDKCQYCGLHPSDEYHDRGSSMFTHPLEEWPAHRIWRVARIVTGKNDA